MYELTFALTDEEETGLRAVTHFDGRVESGNAVAHELLHAGLAARLTDLGLPWAPTDEQIQAGTQSSDPATAEAQAPPSRTGRRAAVEAVFGVVGVLAVVALAGGYIGGWRWTGFPANHQLWDWLHLLLLPVAFATLPLWLKHAEYMSAARRLTYGAVVAAFTVFVVLGYEIPLRWTGFTGNTLWDWLTLILLPVTLITARTWSRTGRQVRAQHRILIGVLAAAWLVTVVGGYLGHWRWTGYQGNTLWDWLQLVLAPIVLPTVVAPALVRFVTGNVARRAEEARSASSGPSPAVAHATSEPKRGVG